MNYQNTYPVYTQGQDHPDQLFPEIYRVLQPAVKSALDMWLSQSPSPESLTVANLDHMVINALHMAGLDNECDETVSAMAPRNHYRRPYRPSFNANDLTKILLLQEFFRRYGYYPPYAPYPYYRY